MATQGERITALETHRTHDSELLEKVDLRLGGVEKKIDDIHDGLKWFIRGAKFTAALGMAIMALKGAVSWSDVRDAFRAI